MKLDMALVRGVGGCRRRRAIVHGVLAACRDLGIQAVAEGVEAAEELAVLRDIGVRYAQGYLFARPPTVVLPALELCSDAFWRGGPVGRGPRSGRAGGA